MGSDSGPKITAGLSNTIVAVRDAGWMRQAVCASSDIDPDLFFREPTKAKAICVTCPVTEQCRAFVDQIEPPLSRPHGVFGGETARQRYQRRRSDARA